MTVENRLSIARASAGLSLGQAAKMLGIKRDALVLIERQRLYDYVEKMSDIYGVRVEWLRGEVPRHDYERVDEMKGAENLTAHDRDVLAEFAASMPRNPKTPSERLAEVAERRCVDSHCELPRGHSGVHQMAIRIAGRKKR